MANAQKPGRPLANPSRSDQKISDQLKWELVGNLTESALEGGQGSGSI
jgi:hypothetical protein